MTTRRIRVWDAPTRVFHWALVLAVGGAVVTGQLGGGWMDWHGRIGVFIAGLLGFRLGWGLLGSTYARFARFFPTPARLAAYWRGAWPHEGHNPLGALSVFALLGVLLAQVLTGVFSNDDITFTGPLAGLVDKALSNRLTGLHGVLADGLIGLVTLHVGAIVFYARVKKKRLLPPMISGWVDSAQGEPAQGGGRGALLVALTLAGLAAVGASGVWLPPPPPAPVGQTPNW